jgi:hypothetical protein
MVMVILDHVYVYFYGYAYAVSLLSFNVGFGMNLYHSNQVLIKFDQLKLLITVS